MVRMLREIAIPVLIAVIVTSMTALATPVLAAGNPEKFVVAVEQPPSLGDKDIPSLVAMLQDQRMTYRSAAAQELGRRKDKAAVVPLRGLLKDEVPFVRVDAAEALFALGDNSGIPTLREMLTSPSSTQQILTPGTALRAAGILAAHGDSTGEVLAKSRLGSKYFTNRLRALDVLKLSKDVEVAYSALKIGINDSEGMVRRSAAHALGEMGTKRALDILTPLLSSTDTDDRCAAVWAISDMRLWDAIPLLINALGDSQGIVRIHAAADLNTLTNLNKPEDSAWKADKAKELELEWRRWWEDNKANYPSGGKSSAPKIIPKHYAL